MDELNLTIQRNNDIVWLTEGFPDHLGIVGASLYVAFTYTNIHVVVWATDALSDSERKSISLALLKLIKHKLTSNDVSVH